MFSSCQTTRKSILVITKAPSWLLPGEIFLDSLIAQHRHDPLLVGWLVTTKTTLVPVQMVPPIWPLCCQPRLSVMRLGASVPGSSLPWAPCSGHPLKPPATTWDAARTPSQGPTLFTGPEGLSSLCAEESCPTSCQAIPLSFFPFQEHVSSDVDT